MKIPELLIPAGNAEKLRTAVRFGADAVYVGGEDFSLRTNDTGFSIEELELGIRFAHERGVKVYLALNIFPYDQEVNEMIAYLKRAVPLGIDAVIVSDVGLIQEIQQLSLAVKIHLSTQANTTNAKAVQFWGNQGISRVVLARELNLLQIAEIKKQNPHIEIEAFIHGAMCMSYSGRCLLSKHFTGRDANHGECSHPCRWKYSITEESDPERVLEIETTERGTYIMNAKDLCMIQHIPDLVYSGLDSLKVEGRMKSPYYVAIVTRVYRQAIDQFCLDPQNYRVNPEWQKELENISHRPYYTGFYFGTQDSPQSKQEECSSEYIKKYNFVGTVIEHDQINQKMLLQVRNRIQKGEMIDIIDPYNVHIQSVLVESITDEKGVPLEAAHNQYTVWVNCPDEVSAYSIVRVPRVVKTSVLKQ